MINLIQRIFLPANKLANIKLKKEIMRIVKTTTAHHDSYMTASGSVVNHFSIHKNGLIVDLTRTFDKSRPEKYQIIYNLRLDDSQRIIYATNSDIDKFVKKVYNKTYTLWDNARKTNAK